MLESVRIPSPELADLKCKLGTWAVDRCSIFHSAKSHLRGIALSYQPLPSSRIRVIYTNLGSSARIQMPTQAQAASAVMVNCMIEKLEAKTEKTKWKLEIL